MKKFLTAVFVTVALCLYSLPSYSQSMTIETYNTQEPPQGEYDGRTAVSSYEITNGVDPTVYIKYELNGNGAWETHPLMILITKDDGSNVYSYPFDPGGSSGIYYATSTPIPAGNYTVKIVEGGDESSVWAKKDIKVTAAMTKVGGSKNIIFCDYVDDNWNPIGVVTSIKAGECVNLMVELPKAIKNFRTVDWEIFKMNSDGTDQQYVTQLMMGLGNDENVKRFATTEKVCQFTEKGKYRVYAIDWGERSINGGTGNFKKYYAKGELTVE